MLNANGITTDNISHLESSAADPLEFLELLRRDLLVLQLETLEIESVDILLVLVNLGVLGRLRLLRAGRVMRPHEQRFVRGTVPPGCMVRSLERLRLGLLTSGVGRQIRQGRA